VPGTGEAVSKNHAIRGWTFRQMERPYEFFPKLIVKVNQLFHKIPYSLTNTRFKHPLSVFLI
jgi:hypothetical protein